MVNERGAPRRRSTRAVSGIVLLDKPRGLSSNQALQKVKRLFRAAKAGHTGSLDPLASGLLPICLGEATKIAGLLLGARKCYEAEVELGVVTRGGDREGEVIAERPVPALDAAAIEAVLARFRGTIQQVPPAHSALKRGGVPAYKLARQGVEVVLAPRAVTIDELALVAREGPLLQLRVVCSAGTYIRSLARDIGEAIGCGAHLARLRRPWAEPFAEPALWSLDDIESAAEQGDAALAQLLLPLEAGLRHLPALDLGPADADAVRHGRPIPTPLRGLFRVRAAGSLLALAEAGDDGVLRVRRGFNEVAPSLVPSGDEALK